MVYGVSPTYAQTDCTVKRSMLIMLSCSTRQMRPSMLQQPYLHYTYHRMRQQHCVQYTCMYIYTHTHIHTRHILHTDYIARLDMHHMYHV